MNDGALLNTPGELLAAARERRGLSLPELSARTKIPVPMLEALEKDEYHRISDPLYVKSFLRAAAVEVGLDPAELLDLHARVTGAARPGAAPEEVWEERPVTIRRVGVPWGRILAVVGGVVAVVAVVVLAVVRLGGGDDGPEAPPRTSPPAASGARTVAPAQRESLLAQTGTADTTVAPASAAAREEAPKPEATADAAPGPAAEPAAERAPRALPAAPPGGPDLPLGAGAPRDQVLRVLAAGPVTVALRRDGERTFTSFRLPGATADLDPLPDRDIRPGRPYAVREGVVAYWGARDHFDLVLDRVDGVEISRNGQVRDLSRVRPGDEIVLDGFSDPAGP